MILASIFFQGDPMTITATMPAIISASGLPRLEACSASVARWLFHVAAVMQAGQRIGDRISIEFCTLSRR